MGQEGRPGEAGGTEALGMGSWGSVEVEEPAPWLEVEEGEEDGLWVQG